MKHLLLSLPLTIALAGCTPAADTSTATSTAPDSTSSTTTTNTTSDSTAANSTAGAGSSAMASSSDTSSSANASSPYTVIDETPPGAPPEMVAALKKVKAPPPSAKTKLADKTRVKLDTSKGPIVVELNGKAAPLHVRSFLHLTSRKFFNGTRFHRFANLMEGAPDGKPGNIIQGGDPLSKDPKTRAYAGTGGPGYQIPRERNSLKHDAMVLAAARSQDPDSAGSQFYITQNPVYFLDENDGYTVFGKVVSGQANALKLRQDDVLKSVTVVK